MCREVRGSGFSLGLLRIIRARSPVLRPRCWLRSSALARDARQATVLPFSTLASLWPIANTRRNVSCAASSHRVASEHGIGRCGKPYVSAAEREIRVVRLHCGLDSATTVAASFRIASFRHQMRILIHKDHRGGRACSGIFSGVGNLRKKRRKGLNLRSEIKQRPGKP